MFDHFQGDPRITLDENGASLSVSAGQPKMDQGFENVVLIDLFTDSDWWGNTVLRDEKQRVGSDFEKTARGPMTVDTLVKTESAGRVALQHLVDEGLASEVVVAARNPSSGTVEVGVIIRPPSRDLFTLLATKHGPNWIAQRDYPAYERIE